MRSMKILFPLVLVASMLLVSCGGAATPTPAMPDEGGGEGPIKIGISLPLTGRRSEGGIAAKQGYEVWADMVNDNGGMLGRQVELVIIDNASDPDTAVSDYEKLITVDKVPLVVGPFSSALVGPTSAVAAKYGYAFVEPAGGAPSVFEPCYRVLFFAQPTQASFQGVTSMEWLKELPDDIKPKTIAYPQMDDPMYDGQLGYTIPLLEEAGFQTVYREVFPQETTDFSTIALGLKNANADMIWSGNGYQTGIDLTRALAEVGYNPKIYWIVNATSFPQFGPDLGPLAEGILGPISWHETFATFENDELVSRHKARFGEVAEDAANAFTVGQVLFQAVEAVGSIDNTALVDYIHANSFNTVVGQLKFDECGRPEGYFHLFQWQNGEIVIIYPYDAATGEYKARPDW